MHANTTHSKYIQVQKITYTVNLKNLIKPHCRERLETSPCGESACNNSRTVTQTVFTSVFYHSFS